MLTLDGLLQARATDTPTRLIYTFLDADGNETATWTGETLLARARTIAGNLVTAGIGHEPVLLCVGPGAQQPAMLLGCFLAGATAVPVYPPADAAALAAIAGVARACGARWLLAEDPTLADRLQEVMGDGTPRAVPATETAVPALPGARPDDTAIILYTSGSTGEPKGVVITHRAFTGNLAALAAACGRSADDVICTWLPHAHIAGLYTRLLPLALGARAVVLPAAAFAGRPALWLETMSRYRCTLTAAPDFAFALAAQVVSPAAAAALDLTALTMAVSGGELVRPATLARFAERFAVAGFAPSAWHPYYGLTETLCTSVPQRSGTSEITVSRSGILHGRLRAPADDSDAVTLVGNGQPLGDDTEVLAIDPETRRPVEPGLIGELWTRGHAVTRAYYGDAERTREACEAVLADGRGPWFRTGDLGFVHDGQVFITGRLKELIIVRGKNHYPLDIEATVTAAAGVPVCAAFAIRQDDDEEALALAVELADREESADTFLRRVRRAVATRHGLVIHRLYLLPPGGLPRTATNKVSRARCRQLATSGAWDGALVSAVRQTAAAPSTPLALELRQLRGPALQAALLARLVELVATAEDDPRPGDLADAPVAELGLSSLALARIAADLRTHTGIEPPFAAFYDGRSLRDVAGEVTALLEGSRPRERPAAGWREVVRQVVRAMPNTLPPQRTRPGHVLLTGGTGFLGAWILGELLRQGTGVVECLVRADDAASGRDRLIRSLAGGPGWDPAWSDRLVALPGDVAAPRFGLGEADWEALADRTATIVHNAANVNFVAPYTALKAVNVDPVQAVVDLAIRGGETRRVHLVSTTAVFNGTNRREQRRILGSDRLVQPDYLYSGYAQSKWVAETAFRTANLSGLPLVMHRPGLIIGDTRQGRAHADDFLCRFIKGCIELGVYPDADIELDLVPVDDVGAGIAAAVLQPSPHVLDVCQWTCPNTVTLADLMTAFRRRGHALAPEPLPAWLARVRTSLAPDNALYPVHPFLFELPPDTHDTILEMFDGLPLNVDATEADAVRAAAGLTAHAVDAEQLDRMAAWLESSGFLSTPAHQPA